MFLPFKRALDNISNNLRRLVLLKIFNLSAELEHEHSDLGRAFSRLFGLLRQIRLEHTSDLKRDILDEVNEF